MLRSHKAFHVMFEFVEVNTDSLDHIQCLYDLLKKKNNNISHIHLPEFEEHAKFVINNPYRFWYLIQKSSKTYASAYITNDNVIGINLPSNKYQEYLELMSILIKLHKPLPPIKSIRSQYFTVNLNPNNLNLIHALESLGMEHLQNTYVYKSTVIKKIG